METEDEKRRAKAYERFEKHPAIKYILEMHQDGLITTVDMASSIFREWHHFKQLPQNEGIHFDD